MRLASDSFEKGYVVSHDKGFLPALHYLEHTRQGKGHRIAMVECVSEALESDVSESLKLLSKDNVTFTDFEAFLLSVMDKEAASKLVSLLKESVRMEIMVEDAERFVANAANKKSATKIPSPQDLVKATGTTEEEPCALEDLPGIGRILATKLTAAGIASPSALRNVGAVAAWHAIRSQNSSFPMRWVYTFEAALAGMAVGELCAERKAQIQSEITLSLQPSLVA